MPDSLTAAARVAFFIGQPVAHAAMPARVNAVTRQRGRDAMMVPMDLPSAAIIGFMDMLRVAGNVDGAVVTSPHKQAVTGLVDRLTETARFAGAVNVVLRGPDGNLIGDNTDGAGFVRALRSGGGVPTGKRAVLFGCGGAGTSIAAALAAAGLERLELVDADPTRAEKLAERLGGISAARRAPDNLEGYALVVNATAIGLHGQGIVNQLTGLERGAIVADVVTSPALTPFLMRARQAGARIQTGIEMSAEQVPLVLQRLGWSGA